MTKFENLGYCPYNEIVHTEEKIWKELSENEIGYRTALWNLVGANLVCKTPPNSSYLVEAGKLFFGTKYLSNKVLNAVIKRYDFAKGSPIWITQPRKGCSDIIPIAEIIITEKDNNPEVIFDSFDAGKVVVVYNGLEGELYVALWNTSYELFE